MAKLTFTQPETRPSFTVAEIEAPLRIDQNTRRVSGFYRKAARDGEWLESHPYDFALADLDLSGAGGPLAKIERGILLRLVATGALPAGTVEVS